MPPCLHIARNASQRTRDGRRTREGDVLLSVVNVEQQQPRSERIERFQSATIMNRGFTLRFRS